VLIAAGGRIGPVHIWLVMDKPDDGRCRRLEGKELLDRFRDCIKGSTREFL
jgi:hypothetical protein